MFGSPACYNLEDTSKKPFLKPFFRPFLAVNLSNEETVFEETFEGERIGAMTPDCSRFVMLCTENKNYPVLIYDMTKETPVRLDDSHRFILIFYDCPYFHHLFTEICQDISSP